MDALKLYNFNNFQQQKVYTLPKKKQKKNIVVSNQVKVKYTCYNCKKEVYLSASEVVCCTHCDSRVVYKEAKQKKIVYNSV